MAIATKPSISIDDNGLEADPGAQHRAYNRQARGDENEAAVGLEFFVVRTDKPHEAMVQQLHPIGHDAFE
jgi:hypothetical protein